MKRARCPGPSVTGIDRQPIAGAARQRSFISVAVDAEWPATSAIADNSVFGHQRFSICLDRAAQRAVEGYADAGANGDRNPIAGARPIDLSTGHSVSAAEAEPQAGLPLRPAIGVAKDSGSTMAPFVSEPSLTRRAAPHND